ncbi:BQ2448_4354 [Microbotryum intermedium]|uniref:BQ2448_4354 protein n=1 Tax=Microbotryum intermedium TaxID=269621 RepID=A0A238FHV0_9BASI|nr:BQ2448_4354 [Microbotryum intermedium]
MVIIAIFLRSHNFRIGLQDLEDMLAFAAVVCVSGLPAGSSVRQFLANLENEVQLFKPRQSTKDRVCSIHVVSPRDYVAAVGSGNLLPEVEYL